MYYHLLTETTDAAGNPTYTLVKTYKKWAGRAMMEFLLRQDGNVWIVAGRPNLLNDFSAIGMPSTYVWTPRGWHESRMPVRPLA